MLLHSKSLEARSPKGTFGGGPFIYSPISMICSGLLDAVTLPRTMCTWIRSDSIFLE